MLSIRLWAQQQPTDELGEWLSRLDLVDWIVFGVIALSWLLPVLKQLLSAGQAEVPEQADEDEALADPRPIEPR